MAEVLKAYEFKIDSITLIPSDAGKFEVMVGDRKATFEVVSD